MLKAIKPLRNLNDINTITSNVVTKTIKITYNDGKCIVCNEDKDIIPITNDGGSLSYCKKCNKQVIIFEYIDQNKYDEKIKNKQAVITYYK